MVGICVTLALAAISIGLLQLMNTVGSQAEIQLNLDHCTAAYSIKLRAAAMTMEASYKRIEAYKVATLAICSTLVGCPPVLRAARLFLKFEKGVQGLTRNYWQLQQASWKSRFGSECSAPVLANRDPLPDFPFQVIQGNESDLLNPIPEFRNQTNLDISIHYKNLVSTANLKFPGGEYAWTLSWTK